MPIPYVLPWAKLAAKIDYFPEDNGQQLKSFWKKRVKYRDVDGTVKFKKMESNLPNKVHYMLTIFDSCLKPFFCP